MTAGGRVILLNGAGSAGKSSIARALQEILPEPYLHLSMDGFLEMLPAAYFDRPDGMRLETIEEDGYPSVFIHVGPVVERLLAGMRRAVAAMAGQGNNLIVDDVMLGDELADYRSLLQGFSLGTVGVTAPIDVLEARERERGDRTIGLARWQHRRVHAGKSYDLVLDTSTATPLDCATRIKEHFAL